MLLTIEKLVYGGDGLARRPDKTIFIPFVLEGEQVDAQIIEERPGFARAQLTEIVSGSPRRVDPPCPYFGRCGGCHYQHTNYEHQLEIKSAILRETLRRIGKLDWSGDINVHPSPPWNYRNRTRMRIMRHPEFSLAYFRSGSHEPLAIAECPISSPLINRAIAAINAIGDAPPELNEIEFFADVIEQDLMLELYCEGSLPPSASCARFSDALRLALPEIVCIAASVESNQHERDSSVLSQRKSRILFGDEFLNYRTAGGLYRVSPGSFFQTNRFMTDDLVQSATANTNGKLALDLYAGVGLFTIPLSRTFAQVIAVESSPASIINLRENAPQNVTEYGEPVERFLAQSQRLRPDFVIVDPPRAGLGERVARQLAALAAPRITYVSCDPSTLARDLRVLTASQYVIEQIHLVDLFPQTYHLETVVCLTQSA